MTQKHAQSVHTASTHTQYKTKQQTQPSGVKSLREIFSSAPLRSDIRVEFYPSSASSTARTRVRCMHQSRRTRTQTDTEPNACEYARASIQGSKISKARVPWPWSRLARRSRLHAPFARSPWVHQRSHRVHSQLLVSVHSRAMRPERSRALKARGASPFSPFSAPPRPHRRRPATTHSTQSHAFHSRSVARVASTIAARARASRARPRRRAR
mmetsp:Transcript_1440/g.5255  ORF Transcript_1440/g.5255 Transcript_1440/m.5255 type:complete len:212 (+) Transcript_1440:6113-6748(+)